MKRFLPCLANALRRFKDGLAFSSGALYPPRRRLLLGSAMLAAAIALPHLAGAQAWSAEHWTTTWGTAPAGPPPDASLQAFTDA